MPEALLSAVHPCPTKELLGEELLPAMEVDRLEVSAESNVPSDRNRVGSGHPWCTVAGAWNRVDGMVEGTLMELAVRVCCLLE